MWLKTFLSTIQSKPLRDLFCVLGNIIMAISILYALLTMDAKEISFVYANF